VKRGFLFQGQYYPRQRKRRGTPTWGVPAPAFVVFLQNPDQIANTPGGARLHALTSPGRYRAITALLLLAPGTPMLFQGQEFAATAPFHFFADHAESPELAAKVDGGRREFVMQFPSLRDERARGLVPSPHDVASFEASKLDLTERATHRAAYDLVKELLRVRRADPTFAAQRADWLETAVVGPEALALRFATGTGDDRLVLVNLGQDLDLGGVAEPLLAPPVGAEWVELLSTEDPRFGGTGTPPPGKNGEIQLAGASALVLAPGAGLP
jgi:maltooligosyltrehalose trehalohydrolase